MLANSLNKVLNTSKSNKNKIFKLFVNVIKDTLRNVKWKDHLKWKKKT